VGVFDELPAEVRCRAASKTRFRGERRTRRAAYFVAAAYNLTRMSRLVPLAL
jgi:hypothetical protein